LVITEEHGGRALPVLPHGGMVRPDVLLSHPSSHLTDAQPYLASVINRTRVLEACFEHRRGGVAFRPRKGRDRVCVFRRNEPKVYRLVEAVAVFHPRFNGGLAAREIRLQRVEELVDTFSWCKLGHSEPSHPCRAAG